MIAAPQSQNIRLDGVTCSLLLGRTLRYLSERTTKLDFASHHADFVLSCLPIPSRRFLGIDDDGDPNASNFK